MENVSDTLKPNKDISLDIQCESVTLNINQAIPASLIVNEVITNAYKHAFKDRQEGKITFRLYKDGKRIFIEIEDNGTGMPSGNGAITRKSSLGIHLIKLLSQQIDSSYRYEGTGNGTHFKLEFDKEETKAGIGNARLK